MPYALNPVCLWLFLLALAGCGQQSRKPTDAPAAPPTNEDRIVGNWKGTKTGPSGDTLGMGLVFTRNGILVHDYGKRTPSFPYRFLNDSTLFFPTVATADSVVSIARLTADTLVLTAPPGYASKAVPLFWDMVFIRQPE